MPVEVADSGREIVLTGHAAGLAAAISTIVVGFSVWGLFAARSAWINRPAPSEISALKLRYGGPYDTVIDVERVGVRGSVLDQYVYREYKVTIQHIGGEPHTRFVGVEVWSGSLVEYDGQYGGEIDRFFG